MRMCVCMHAQVCNLTNASFMVEDIEIIDDPEDFNNDAPADTSRSGNRG